MTVNNHLLCLLFLCLSIASSAQKNNRLLVEVGINTQQVVDQRFTTDAKYDLGFQTNFHYEFGKKANINRMTLGLATNIADRQQFITFKQLLGEYKYTHLRPINQSHYLGFFVDSGNASSFALGKWSGSNGVTYTIWTSIGLSTYWEKSFSINNRKLVASFDAAIPFLGYVVRPSYGHPYPQAFLKDGTFKYSREGMAKYLLTSGKVRTVNSFMNINTKASLAIPFGEKGHQVGMTYNWKYIHVGNDRPIWITQHQFSLQTIIKF